MTEEKSQEEVNEVVSEVGETIAEEHAALSEPEVPVGSEFVDNATMDTVTIPPVSDWHTPPVEVVDEAKTQTQDPPQDPPAPTEVAAAGEPEKRPKVWHKEAQKWVDPETGE